MTMFPTLKTGAVMQYPAQRQIEFSTQVVRFLDGSEQRYRDRSPSVKRWIVRLDQLGPKEWRELQAFFDSMQGQAGTFTFTDPWDGVEYPNCSLENDELALYAAQENDVRVTLVVRENLN